MLALRSVLDTNDFEKVVQETGKVLFCPRIEVPKNGTKPSWCVALCGDVKEGPQTIEEFAVYTLDSKGRPAAKPDCKVKMEGPKGPVKVQIQPSEDGTFDVTYDEDDLSSTCVTVNVTVDGKPTEDSPAKVKIGKPVDTELCSATGPGLEELIVQARDAGGKPTEGLCTVVMQGPNGPVEVKVEDVGNGTFKAKYEPLVPGDYTIDAMIDSKPIAKYRVQRSAPLVKGKDDSPIKDQKTTPNDVEYSTVFSSGSGIYSSGTDPTPPKFTGFQGSPPLTGKQSKEQLVALRSILRKNDFEKVTLPNGEVLLCPRMEPIESDGQRWCMALCNPENGSDVDKFAVYSITADGKPGEKLSEVQMTSPDGPVKMKVNITDEGVVHVNPDFDDLSSSDYTVSITVDGQLTDDSPTKIQCGKIAEPANCSCEPPGLEELVVYARDSEGNPTGGLCTAIIKGPNGPVEAQVVDSGDGSFRVSYGSLPPGDYNIEAMVDGQLVAKYKCKTTTDDKIKPAADDEHKLRKALQYTTVYSSGCGKFGSGVAETSQIIDKDGRNLCHIDGPTLEDLTVYVRDTGGRDVEADVTVEIDGPNGPIETEVQDTGDGYYIKYEALNKVPGDYTINVLVNMFSIAMYKVTTVKESKKLIVCRKANPMQCFIKGPSPEELTIYVLSYEGLPTDGECAVEITGPNGPVDTKINKTETGVYCVKYSPLNKIPGNYRIIVMIDSYTIAAYNITTVMDSRKLQLRGVADMKQCRILGPSPEELTVLVRGYDGKPAEGICQVGIVGPKGPVEVKMEILELGTHRARYHPLNSEIGEYLITIMVDSQYIAKFKVQVTEKFCQLNVRGVIDGRQCFVSKPDIEELTVNVRGFDGQPVDGECVVTITGPKGAIKVNLERTSLGVYLARYSALNIVPGDYIITVTVESQLICRYQIKTIKGSRRIRRRRKATGRFCSITGPGMELLQVSLKDKDGKAADGTCSVSIEGPDGPVEVKMEDLGESSYHFKYNALNSVLGSYCIKVWINCLCIQTFQVISTATGISIGSLCRSCHKNLEMRNFCIYCGKVRTTTIAEDSQANTTGNVAIYAKIDQCLAEGSGLKGIKEESICQFTVHTKDSDGEPSQGASCRGYIRGPKGPVNLKLKIAGTGVFQGKYDAVTEPGDYSITLFIDGQEMKDSPYQFKI